MSSSQWDNPNQNAFVPEAEISNKASGAIQLGKVFLYMLYGLLITAGIGALFTFLYTIWFPGGAANHEGFVNLTIGGSIAGCILIIVFSVLAGAFSTSTKQSSRSVAVPFVLYSAVIGFMFSFVPPYLEQIFTVSNAWNILAISFGVSIFVYGLMALIGLLSKGNLNFLGVCAGALGLGVLVVSLFSWLFMFKMPNKAFNLIYFVIPIIVFVMLMLTTIWDIWRVKKIAQTQPMTPNMSLFLAFRLYCDFIAVFIRILYFVIIIAAKKN